MTRLEQAVQDAITVFWCEIALAYPEIKSGDLNPFLDFEFKLECLNVVQKWLKINGEKPLTD